MIRFVYADQLRNFPVLAESMFKDRAVQFKDRLHWDVTVDENGWELDEYDSLNPLYVIYEDASGRHAGSMRIMPSLGRIMTNEHFSDLAGGVKIGSPFIWECTRYCLAPGAGASVAAALLLAGCELGIRFGLEQALGVFDARMPRIYSRIGWSPDVIGTGGEGRDRISVGLWDISEEARAEISKKSGIPLSVVAYWFDASFNMTAVAEEAEPVLEAA